MGGGDRNLKRVVRVIAKKRVRKVAIVDREKVGGERNQRVTMVVSQMTKSARKEGDKKEDVVKRMKIKENAKDLDAKTEGIIMEMEMERQGKHQQTQKAKKPKKPKDKDNEEKPKKEKKERKYSKKKPDHKEKVDKEVNAMLSSLGLASLPSKSDLDSLHCVYHEVANLVRDCAQKKLNE